MTDRYHCKMESKSGLTVTGRVIEGEKRYFHSVYDPRQEADRMAAGSATDSAAFDTVICLGFGSGHHLRSLTSRWRRVVVVDPSPEAVAYALDHVDLSDILGSPSLELVIEPNPGRIHQGLVRAYLPVLHGSAVTVSLQGARRVYGDRFAELENAVAGALDSISADFATQARFGRTWMRNTIINLKQLSANQTLQGGYSVVESLAGRNAIVTAAGPSLEAALGNPQSLEGGWVLATDTSLPALLARGVIPDAVLTVDCQQLGYLHYLTAGFPAAYVIADISASPCIFGHSKSICPLLSQHPLHQLLKVLGLEVPDYDSSAGTVTHAAAGFAISRDSASVTILGADHAYPRGEPYVRGVYADTWFASRANRLNPVGGQIYGFVRSRPGVYMSTTVPGTYRVPVMDRYEQSIRILAAASATPVLFEPGSVSAPSASSIRTDRRPGINPVILDRLAELYEDHANGRSSSETRRAVTQSVLPLAAWHRRMRPSAPADELVRDAVHDTIATIRQVQSIHS